MSPVHVDRPLSQYVLTYENKQLIADKLAPVVLVDNQSDSYFVKPKGNAMKYVGQPTIGLTSDIPEVESGFTLAKFATQDYGFLSKVALSLDANADAPLNLRQDAAMDAAALLWLAREVRVASLLTTTANYAAANSTTVGSKWDIDANDPIVQIEAMRANLFPSPNGRLVAFMGYAVWAAVKNNAKVLSRVNGGATTGSPAQVSRQKFAELIEVDEVVVGEAYAIDANGAQTRVWGKDFGMVYVANSPSTRAMTFSQTFRWNKPGPGGIAASRWIDPSKGIMGVERSKIAHSDAEVIAASDAGILMKAAVS